MRWSKGEREREGVRESKPPGSERRVFRLGGDAISDQRRGGEQVDRAGQFINTCRHAHTHTQRTYRGMNKQNTHTHTHLLPLQ